MNALESRASKRARRIFAACGCLAAALLSLTSTSGQAAKHDRMALIFHTAAWGTNAVPNQSWRLTPGPRAIGLAASVGICGDEVFWVDTLSRAVHRFSLSDGRLVGSLGPRTDGTSELQIPLGLAVDCEGHALYVVDDAGVFHFDLESNTLVRRFPRPATFMGGLGAAILDRDAGLISIPGLWTPVAHDWLSKSLGNMFQGDRLGWTLNMTTGASVPMFESIESGCWTDLPDCPFIRLDRVRSVRREAWIVAHTVSTLVGIFDWNHRLLRTIDVRSPMFLENGSWNRRSASLEQKMTWSETNSLISNVYAFGDDVITIHTLQATKNWKRHGQVDFEVFMNVHSLDGSGIVSDIRLPGLPVARDAENLYVIDYGARGRRRAGTGDVTLISIPVTENVNLYR